MFVCVVFFCLIVVSMTRKMLSFDAFERMAFRKFIFELSNK